MFDRTIESDPRPAAPHSRATATACGTAIAENTTRAGTAGPSPSANGAVRALADIGIYGAVSSAISPRLASAAIPTPRGGP